MYEMTRGPLAINIYAQTWQNLALYILLKYYV